MNSSLFIETFLFFFCFSSYLFIPKVHILSYSQMFVVKIRRFYSSAISVTPTTNMEYASTNTKYVLRKNLLSIREAMTNVQTNNTFNCITLKVVELICLPGLLMPL